MAHVRLVGLDVQLLARVALNGGSQVAVGLDLSLQGRSLLVRVARGGQVVRNNIDVDLAERNAYASLQAAYVASGKQSIDHQTRINHTVAHCESHELYKGIIDDQASAAFNGKVYVHPDAQKTNAYQQNDTMVISPHALMNSKPQLEIFEQVFQILLY